MPTQYQLVDPPTSTLQYEYLQSKVMTQYYIQYSIDTLFIIGFSVLLVYTFTRRNWVSEIFGKMIERLKS